jgi:ADP-ribose pyrophosphatase YjhB (NUDIX family)
LALTEPPLYERDPDAWNALLVEANRTQPRKRVAADVLFRDETGRILLVDPTYKPGWDLPGGMAEANEPPLDAAIREVREELSLDYRGGPLLVVEWVAPHGPWDDSLIFVFDGGVLNIEQQAAIRLGDGELRDVCFVTEKKARGLLRPDVWLRVTEALDAPYPRRARYMQSQE